MTNLDFAGFIGIDSGLGSVNGPCEWFSSVVKDGTNNSGGQSTCMYAFLFAYCSTAKDVGSGGPGAIATLSFWDGFQNGIVLSAGSRGTNLHTFTVTGLPGNTGLTSYCGSGFANCVAFVLNVNVAGALGTNVPVVVPDSSLGLDPDGMIDRIDNYCAGTFLTSFSFLTAGFGASSSSNSFELRELCPIDSSDSAVSTPAGNTGALAIDVAPHLGAAFEVTQSLGYHSPTSVLRVAFAPNPGAPLSLGGTKGDLLVALGAAAGVNFISTGNAANEVSYISPFPLPMNLAFFGFDMHMQGFGFASSGSSAITQMSDRVDITVGSQN